MSAPVVSRSGDTLRCAFALTLWSATCFIFESAHSHSLLDCLYLLPGVSWLLHMGPDGKQGQTGKAIMVGRYFRCAGKQSGQAGWQAARQAGVQAGRQTAIRMRKISTQEGAHLINTPRARRRCSYIEALKTHKPIFNHVFFVYT